MTPRLPDILVGNAAALSTPPPPPEAAGDYMAGRLGIIAMLSLLAAQEAERGLEVRLWENAEIRALLTGVGETPPPPSAGHTWSALDEDNARLRRRLIGVHEAAEARGDVALDRRILRLYVEMAKARLLHLPPS